MMNIHEAHKPTESPDEMKHVIHGKNTEAVQKLSSLEAPHVYMKERDFTFKTDKLGNKRDPIRLSYPVPTFEGIVEALANYKTWRDGGEVILNKPTV
jgi:hypothetical protein